MINNINWWHVKSNPAVPPKKKRCTWKKGKDESEKAATTSTGTYLASDTTGSQELWTRILTSVGLSNYDPTVPCAFNSRWQLSLVAIKLVALARALAPCHIQAVAVCMGEGLSLYSFSTWNIHAIIMIQYHLSVGEIFHIQAYHHLLTVLSSMITC